MKLQIGDNIILTINVGSRGIKGEVYKVTDVSEYNEEYIPPTKLPEGQLWVEGRGVINDGSGGVELNGVFQYLLDEVDYEIV